MKQNQTKLWSCLRISTQQKSPSFTLLAHLEESAFCVGLEEKGVEALQLALQKQIVIPADRAHLALHYANKEDFESALKSLGRIGIGGEITWQELRLRILVALQLTRPSERSC